MTHTPTSVSTSSGSPASKRSEELWAAYRRQTRTEDRAWQRYLKLIDASREAYATWRLVKDRTERAYLAYRRCQETERERFAPTSS